MRLIDADEFEKFVRTHCKDSLADLWCELIRRQPTAFDVERVIGKIENKMFSAELYGDEWNGQTVNNLLCMGDVYDIIKDGG